MNKILSFTLQPTFASFGEVPPQTFDTLEAAQAALKAAAQTVAETCYVDECPQFIGHKRLGVVPFPSADDPTEHAWEEALYIQAEEWSRANGFDYAKDNPVVYLPLSEIAAACCEGFELACAGNEVDWVFAPDKSVSVAWEAGRDARVVEAHKAAVQAAFTDGKLWTATSRLSRGSSIIITTSKRLGVGPEHGLY